MKNKNTASNSFSALFWNSCKKTCFIPIISFAYLFLLTIDNYILYRTNQIYGNKKDYFGFFWNSTYETGFSLVEAFLLIGGLISGIILFRFAQSKKQCNVIFSLGMSRRKIFLAKYLGGLLPLLAALIIAAFFELVSVFCCGYAMSVPLIKIAVYFIASMLAYYALAFTLSSAVTAYSGNIVESLIFTGIIAIFPLVAGLFFGTMRGFYTLGGISVYEGQWNFFNPYRSMFEFLGIFEYVSSYDAGTSIADYFSVYRDNIVLSVYDFSGAIMCFVYAAIIFALAFLFFTKRRNEISGTFGRAKGLNEFCAVLTGFYSMALLTGTAVENFVTDNDKFPAFLISVGAFIIPYFIFKMVFAYKRKLILKSMFKRLTACIAAIAVVTVIFSAGLFGYASRIPDAEDVESVEYASVLANPYSNMNETNALSRNPVYGYCTMNKYFGYNQSGMRYSLFNGNGYQDTYYPLYSVEDESDIQKLIAIHRSFVQKGHIKSTASDSCGTNFQITYYLKNGKTLKRYYTATTEENAKRILGLSDLLVAKSGISEFFESKHNDADAFGISEEDYKKVFDGKDSPNSFYIYSKYLKESHRCGEITEELKKAVLKDLENQTADDIFFHKPEDELGVIRFGADIDFSVEVPDGYYMDENDNLVSEETGDIVKDRVKLLEDTMNSSQNINSDISAIGQDPISIVITKSMTNTLKYLTENGYIKYFDTKITASDVKSIKLATKAETFDAANTDMLPIFIAGYSNSEKIRWLNEGGSLYSESHIFAHNVKNEITSKATIQKVLDSCFLYGYSGTNDRVVEVTFNDGSIATYCITAEVYDKLMK